MEEGIEVEKRRREKCERRRATVRVASVRVECYFETSNTAIVN